MTADIKIRDALPGEFDLIAGLLVDSYRQYQEFMPPPRWAWYIKDMMDVRSRLADSQLIVAESNGKIAGTVTLFLKGSTEHWPENWAGIRLLAVHPSFRGQGIGRALMDECVRRCKALGIKTIGLHTTDFMKVAREMYERMGFKRIPEYDFRPEPNRVVYAYRLDI